MDGNGNRSREEAERWLEVADKLLKARDLVGSKSFAVRARESFPLLEGIDQILAVADTLLAAEKRINNHMDWYAILQLDRRSNDLELIKRQYRRLALLLHPDKNKYIYTENAFKLVNDAWAMLSDPSKKTLYDNELNLFLKFDQISFNSQNPPAPPPAAQAPPLRRSPREKKKTSGAADHQEQNSSSRTETHQAPSKLSTFWTACPYCYNLYEYPRVYEDCCLRCQNCRRAFHATVVPSPPPIVPGKEAYYCCWAFFPLGFSPAPSSNSNGGKNPSLPNWIPFTSMSQFPSQQGEMRGSAKAAEHGSDRDDDDLKDVSDESWDSRPGQGRRTKGKAGNFKGNASTNRAPSNSQTKIGNENASTNRAPSNSQAKIGNENASGQGNFFNESLKDGPVTRGQDKMPQRREVKKVVAKRGRKPVARNRAVGGRSDTVWIDMDLNVEIKDDGDEAAAGEGEGEGIGSIEEEATEGIGFFEGLDDFLGSLPILSVPEDQKVEGA